MRPLSLLAAGVAAWILLPAAAQAQATAEGADKIRLGLKDWIATHLATADKSVVVNFQGPITVEINSDVPGSILISYGGATYETEASEEIRVLPRPQMSEELVFGTDPVKLLLRCSDFLIAAGWPQMAREQFIEYAQRGGVEHLLYTIRDVFELQQAA